MKADLPSLARAFLAAAGLPCADEESVTRGLVAVFAEQRRVAQVPASPSEILQRRLVQATARVCRRFGVSEARLRDLTDNDAATCAARDAWAVELRDAGFSVRAVADEIGIGAASVIRASRRHALRELAGKAGVRDGGVLAAKAVSAERRRAHG